MFNLFSIIITKSYDLAISTFSVPPNTPQIYSGDKRIDTSGAIAGVYNEGDIMNLTCTSTGGNDFDNFIHITKKGKC